MKVPKRSTGGLDDSHHSRGGVHAIILAVRRGFDGEKESRVSRIVPFPRPKCALKRHELHANDHVWRANHRSIGRGVAGFDSLRSARRWVRPASHAKQHLDVSARVEFAFGFQPLQKSDVNRRQGGGNTNLLRYNVMKISPVRRKRLPPPSRCAILLLLEQVSLDGFNHLVRVRLIFRAHVRQISLHELIHELIHALRIRLPRQTHARAALHRVILHRQVHRRRHRVALRAASILLHQPHPRLPRERFPRLFRRLRFSKRILPPRALRQRLRFLLRVVLRDRLRVPRASSRASQKRPPLLLPVLARRAVRSRVRASPSSSERPPALESRRARRRVAPARARRRRRRRG